MEWTRRPTHSPVSVDIISNFRLRATHVRILTDVISKNNRRNLFRREQEHTTTPFVTNEKRRRRRNLPIAKCTNYNANNCCAVCVGKTWALVYTHAHWLQMNDARLFRPHIVCAWLDECFVLNVFHALLLHLHIIWTAWWISLSLSKWATERTTPNPIKRPTFISFDKHKYRRSLSNDGGAYVCISVYFAFSIKF